VDRIIIVIEWGADWVRSVLAKCFGQIWPHFWPTLLCIHARRFCDAATTRLGAAMLISAHACALHV
jgi:hypothetical protein